MSYRAQIDAVYKKKVLDKIEKVTNATALLLHAQLIQTTPVDTGRAKANWFYDIDAPDAKEVEADYDNEGEALQRSQSYTLDKNIFISNNLPYIRRLDEGYSDQAPSGMVQGSLQVAKRQAKEFARTL